MADEAVDQGAGPAQSPLVAVTFQRDSRRKEKYLEAEPKALGITQMGLSAYRISGVGVLLAEGLGFPATDIPLIVLSVVVLGAGILAVMAKNLHLPTLKACLGIQIVACVASALNMILTMIKLGDHTAAECWYLLYSADVGSKPTQEFCEQLQSVHSHHNAVSILVHAVLLAVSATLAAYCCKVVNCCGPAPKMPVITVHSSPEQQTED